MAARRYVAFLRAVNVGGRTVRMEELRAVFAGLGFSGVETFIASGNVIFEASAGSPATLRKKIEVALVTRFKYDIYTFLRTDEDVAAIAAYRPFPKARLDAAVALYVAFVHDPLNAAAERTLAGFETDIDAFHAHGCEVYWLCRKTQSKSGFSNAVFEKALGVRATFRGINTVRRLAEKYPPQAERRRQRG